MESSNLLGAAIRATDEVLQNTMLGDGISFLNETGCSLFFITSSISSMITGEKKRDNAINAAISDIKFEEELQRKKEQYEDEKEEMDVVFKLQMKLLQRMHSREQNCLKLKDDQKINQLDMFFDNWPLASSIAGLLNHIQSSSPFNPSLNVVLGRVQTEIEQDPISVSYKDPQGMSKGITDVLIDNLQELGISKERIHLMNDKCKLYGGALFANLYAVMHSLPTIAISPVVYENKLHINVGCWNQDSTFPYQEDIFVIDYNGLKAKSEKVYKDCKIEEYIQAIVSIIAVINDTYLLSEGRHLESNFPIYAKSKNIGEKYPSIKTFAIKEYTSLISNSQNDLLCDTDPAMSPTIRLSNKHIEVLSSQISELVKSINT